MKGESFSHILISGVFIILFCSVNGCGNVNEAVKQGSSSTVNSSLEDVPEGEPAIINGIILNRDVYPHVSEIILEIPAFDGYERKYTTDIKSDGSFYFKIQPVVAREIIIRNVADVIVIHPGDSIYIVKDFRDISSAKFSGDGADLNQNINKFLGGYYLGRYNTDMNKLPNKAYHEYSGKYRKEALSRLKDFIKKNSPGKEFEIWAEKTINLDYYTTLIDYPIYREFKWKDKAINAGYFDFMSDFYKEFNNEVVTANSYSLIDRYYNSFLGRNVNEKIKRNNQDIQMYDSLLIRELSGNSGNDHIDQFTLSFYLNRLLDFRKLSVIERNADLINMEIKEPFLKKELFDRYSEIKEYALNPKNLSDIMLDRNQETGRKLVSLDKPDVKKLMRNIIDSISNKVIYIDFWAHWCSPCIMEKAYSKKLIEKFSGQPVEFVFICLSDEKLARELENSLKTGGRQYYLTSDEGLYMQNNFGFRSFPHYMLIDKNGTIVDFGGHLRPSLPETVRKVEELISK